MSSRFAPALLALAMLLPLWTANAQTTMRDETRRSIRIRYGRVDTITAARLQSEAGSNAVLGGIIGAAATHDRRNRNRNVAAGALVGALLTKASENRHPMDEITVRLADGSEIKIIQDHIDGIRTGGCVSVEEGQHTNVRGVSAEHCAVGVVADADVTAQHEARAGACERAKEQLVDARTEEDFNFISRKIRMLCH